MTPSQIQAAEQNAKDDAQKLGLVLLLLFKQKKGLKGHEIIYDASSGKFRIDGRAVSVLTIRRNLATIQDTFAKRLTKIIDQLASREISFDEWKRQFDRSVTSTNILAGALTLGSIGAAVNHRAVQEQIDIQLNFADKFSAQLRNSIPRVRITDQPIIFKGMSTARIKARSRSYVQSAHILFSNVELALRIALGVDSEARRVLRASEHCRNSLLLPGCLELARQGWTPIDEMVQIGQATCTIWCKCFIEYR